MVGSVIGRKNSCYPNLPRIKCHLSGPCVVGIQSIFTLAVSLLVLMLSCHRGNELRNSIPHAAIGDTTMAQCYYTRSGKNKGSLPEEGKEGGGVVFEVCPVTGFVLSTYHVLFAQTNTHVVSRRTDRQLDLETKKSKEKNQKKTPPPKKKPKEK